MRTLNRLALCLTLVVSTLSQFATAGVGTSGGGHVVVCSGRSADTLGYVTVLDLYEAQHVHNLTLRPHRENLLEELAVLAGQLQIVLGTVPGLSNPLTAEGLLEWWENRVQYIPGLRGHTRDMGTVPVLPVGCSLQQIAIFDDRHDIVQVNLDLWNSLNGFNQAALIAHEIIYRERRISDFESSSETSRFLVGRVFSTQAVSDSRSMLNDLHPRHP